MKKKQGVFRVCGVLSCAAAAYMLTACGDKLEAPADYALDGDSVESLTAVVGEEHGGELTEMTTPETAEQDAPGDDDSSPAQPVEQMCLYTYEKLETGGSTVEQYVAKLTGEDGAFQIVDEQGTVTDAPDYTQETGSVSLARTASEDGKILRMDITWAAADCKITLTRPEGEVSTAAASVEAMSNSEAVDYIKTLSPEKLGLPGDTMGTYTVYPIDGSVMVDGMLCLRLQVYPPHGPDEANQIAGTYLLSGDKRHLYLLEDGQVQELTL